jgi:hypothetical protein
VGGVGRGSGLRFADMLSTPWTEAPWLAAVALQSDLAQCEEEACWARCAIALEGMLAPGTSFAVRYSPGSARAVKVAARGELNGRRGPCVSIRDGADRAALWCEPRPAEPGREAAALALALALGAFAGIRSERLTRERRALVAHTVRHFTHRVRNDLSALANLADLTLDGAVTDPEAAREAIDETFAQAGDMLRLVGLQARAALPDGRGTRTLRQALRRLAPAAQLVTPPARAVAFPLEDDVLAQLLAVPVAALGGDVDRVRVAEHVDGWAVEFERAGSVPPARRVGWVDVRGQVALGLAALACNLLGGRTWADVDDRGAADRLGLTLPAA